VGAVHDGTFFKTLVRFYFTAVSPKEEQKKKVKARGVSNRNTGLQWIRENNINGEGVIYFADDDNTYDLRLFDEVSGNILVFVTGMLLDKVCCQGNFGNLFNGSFFF